MAKCSVCGTELEEGQKFCFECGAPVPQTKKCIKCGIELPLKMKFCPECGTKQDGTVNASGSGFSMGDKNVIAGDVIGHKEETHIAGNATIIKNEDETKKTAKCHICGSIVKIVDGFDCPECGLFTCENCYDEKDGCCTECAEKHGEQNINRYKEALKMVLADGRIEFSERKELISLQQELGISAEKAKQLEEELKKAALGTGSEITTFEKVSLDKATNLFYKEGNVKEALNLLEPVYKAHKNDEKVLDVYLPVLAEVAPLEALDVINGLQIDILTAFVVSIGIYIKQKNLVEAEKRLNRALRIWHENVLLKCYNVFFNLAMYKQFNDSSFLNKASALSENLGEAQNEIELSYQVKVQAMVQDEKNENIPELTKEFCEQNNLYYHIINTTWFNEQDVKAEELANKIASLKTGNYILHVSGKLDDDDIEKVKTALRENEKAKIELDFKQTEIKKIVTNAFYNCTSLTSIVIPDSVTEIGERAFYNCTSLTSIVIPDSVTEIGECAFDSCTSLISIIIPDSVTQIGNYAFYGCTSLINISVLNNNPKYKSQDGVLYDKNMKHIIMCPNGKKGYFTIPKCVTGIGEDAFFGCKSLTSIEIPDCVTEIGYGAFKSCTSLTSIEISDCVTEIGNNTFLDCTSLTSIVIPDSVTEIGYSAFEGCSSLTSIEIPDSVTEIGERAFYNCTSLTSIVIPDSVTEIGECAFDSCTSLISIIIPDSVTQIGNYAFYGCTSLINISVLNNNPKYKSQDGVLYDKNMKHIIMCPNGKKGYFTIPKCVTGIGEDAFFGCKSLTSIEIPDCVTEIGYGAFNSCTSLTSIEIPDSVTKIGEYVFVGCESLTSIEIPNSVTEISFYAFGGCTSLINISVLNNNPKYKSQDGVLYDKSMNQLIKCPNGKKGCFSIPKCVTGIDECAFYGCTSLTSIEIPDSVTKIGRRAFDSCTSLTSIEIPDSVTKIGDKSFHKCTNLTNVTIPANCEIGARAFDENTKVIRR